MPRSGLSLSCVPSRHSRREPGYPAGLLQLPDPPEQIRLAGSLPNLEHAVAIVGTRYADVDALRFTHDLSAELALAGCCVVSGGARGIDAAAHRGALSAGGKTVAVLATGFDRAYPSAHRELFSTIAARGALVTEAQDGWSPRPGLFLARNRLIAALSPQVVVVQAPFRSGALSTAGHAKRLKRQLFAVPGAPWNPRSAGTNSLLGEGALICTSVRDVLSVPPSKAQQAAPQPRGERKKAYDPEKLDEVSRAVLAALGHRPTHPDELARSTRFSPAVVQHALLTLVLEGAVGEHRPGRYVRIAD